MKPPKRMPDSNGTEDGSCIVTAKVRKQIQDRMCSCSYSFSFPKVNWHYVDGILTLRGSVASFHLKQILQTLLRDIEHVQQLVNNVDVVSATGSDGNSTNV